MIVGISGYIGSGKDTVAKMIQYLCGYEKLGFTGNPSISLEGRLRDFGKGYKELGGWEIKKFAGKLKQIVSLLLDIPVEDLEKEEVKQRVLSEEWSYVGKVLKFKDKYQIIPGIVPEDMKGREHNLTIRELLQKLGTDACRNHIHENIWVNALFADYKPMFPPKNYRFKELSTGRVFTHDSSLRGKKEYDCLGLEPEDNMPSWIISDCRFENEAKAIKDRGGIIIRINRPNEIETIEEDGTRVGKFPHIPHPLETGLDSYNGFDWIIKNNQDLNWLLSDVEMFLKEYKLI